MNCPADKNNNSHTVLAVLSEAVPLIFKLNLKFYPQANDSIIMCIFPHFSQNVLVFYTDELLFIFYEFCWWFSCRLFKSRGGKKTFLGYWSLYIHGKKHTVWHCRQSWEIKTCHIFHPRRSVFLTLPYRSYLFSSLLWFLDLTNHIVNTLKTSEKKKKKLIMALVTCDCKTSNKLQMQRHPF